jgi:hypothetical protein
VKNEFVICGKSLVWVANCFTWSIA